MSLSSRSMSNHALSRSVSQVESRQTRLRCSPSFFDALIARTLRERMRIHMASGFFEILNGLNGCSYKDDDFGRQLKNGATNPK
ncbi:MAG: hypothetical protein MMC23_007170 [Stictis urceolatum]|nr:hypothetical protein [Stictis urceolata]